MKVTIVRGGGLAGIVTETEVDSDQLTPEDADTLEVQVKDAGLSSVSDDETPPSHADEVSYRVTVDDGGESQSVTLREGSMPDAVRSLIAWIDTVPGHKKRISPPRPPAS